MSKKDCQNKAERLMQEYSKNEDPALALKASYYSLMAEDYNKTGMTFVGLLHHVDSKKREYEILTSQWKKYREQIEFLANAFYHKDNRALAEGIILIIQKEILVYKPLVRHSKLLTPDKTVKIISELLKRGDEGKINQKLIGDDGIAAVAWYVSADFNECASALKLLWK